MKNLRWRSRAELTDRSECSPPSTLEQPLHHRAGFGWVAVHSVARPDSWPHTGGEAELDTNREVFETSELEVFVALNRPCNLDRRPRARHLT